MPDPPSFIFLIFERIDNGSSGNLILEVRKMYYPGGMKGEVFRIQNLSCHLSQNKNPILSSREARIEKCRIVNDRGYIRATRILEEYRQKYNRQQDIFTRRLKEYFETVVGRYEKWYDEYHVQKPDVQISIPTREEWTGTKSEFARFIVEYYQNHPAEFPSLRDAVKQFYQRYTFKKDPTWTFEKCYNLARKV